MIGFLNHTLSTDYKAMLENIVIYVNKYLDFYPHIEGFVLGLSGGVDSALCAALADLIRESRGGKLKVIGAVLPIISNKQEETDRGLEAGKYFCTRCDHVDLARAFLVNYTAFRGRPPMKVVGKTTQKEKIERGNIKARTRMSFLYDLAHRENCLVLSTDNLTENQLGFWTLHGDVGDLGMVQNLFKTEVYGLTSYLARRYERDYMQITAASVLRAAVSAKPTDGLGVTDSDLDQLLPGTVYKDYITGYKIIDDRLIKYLTTGKYDEGDPVIKRQMASTYKRENPLNIPRDTLLA